MPLDYINPGVAGAQQLDQYMAYQAAQKRQAMIDQITQQREQVAQANEQRQAQKDQTESDLRMKKLQQDADEKDRTDVEKRVNALLPGDVPDPGLVDLAKKHHLESAFTTTSEGTLVYQGTGDQRQKFQDRKRLGELEKLLPTLETGSPQKQAALLEYERLSGRPLPSGLVNAFDKPAPLAKPQTQPVLWDDPAKGTVKLRQPDGSWAPLQGDAPVGAIRLTAPQPRVGAATETPPDTFRRPDGSLDLDKISLAGGLTNEALLLEAIKVRSTGQNPPIGRTKDGIKLYRGIMNVAGSLVKDANGSWTLPGNSDAMPQGDSLASAGSNYGADKKSQAALQGNVDALEAFAGAATRNVAAFDKILKDIPETGNKLGNWVTRSAADFFGAPSMAAFKTLRLSLQREYGRITSQPTLQGVLSVEAEKAMSTVLSDNAPIGAIQSAMRTLAMESNNRDSSYQQKVREIKQRISGGPGGAAPTTPTRSLDDIRKAIPGLQ